MNLVEGGVIPQTQQAFKNIQEILRAAHADFKVGSYMVVVLNRGAWDAAKYWIFLLVTDISYETYKSSSLPM